MIHVAKFIIRDTLKVMYAEFCNSKFPDYIVNIYYDDKKYIIQNESKKHKFDKSIIEGHLRGKKYPRIVFKSIEIFNKELLDQYKMSVMI